MTGTARSRSAGLDEGGSKTNPPQSKLSNKDSNVHEVQSSTVVHKANSSQID